MKADVHGNVLAREGVDHCDCGCKYWEKDRCVDCGARFEPYCMATVYGPDPQDCGDPAVGSLEGTPLCSKHLPLWQWAAAHQDDDGEEEWHGMYCSCDDCTEQYHPGLHPEYYA